MGLEKKCFYVREGEKGGGGGGRYVCSVSKEEDVMEKMYPRDY